MDRPNIEAAIYDTFSKNNYVDCLRFIELAPITTQLQNQFQILKAQCLIATGSRFPEVHSILDEILIYDPGNCFAHYGKGIAYLNNGQLQKSVESFNLAISYDRDNTFINARIMKARVEKMLHVSSEEDKESGDDHDDESNDNKFQPAFVGSPSTQQLVEVKKEVEEVVEGPQIKTRKLRSPKTCDVCQKSVFDLKRHMKTHTDPPLSCSQCDFTTKLKYIMARHEAFHASEHKYMCGICSVTFKKSQLLVLHENWHKRKLGIFDVKADDGKEEDTQQLLKMPVASNAEAFEKKFLASLLPDIEEMKNEQKETFKLRVNDLLNSILLE